MGIYELFDTYFLQPIRVEQGYNYFNTIVYAVIAFLALYLLNKLFKKHETKINVKFFASLLPFVAVGAFARVLVDKSILSRTFWTISPGIYLTIASLFILSYLLGNYLERKSKIKREKFVFGAGLILLIALIGIVLPINLTNIKFASLILGVFLLWITTVFLVLRKINWEWATRPLPFVALAAQLFDATVTSFIIQFFGAWEKHPLPRAVIEFTGTGFAFVPLKLIVILLALYFISKEMKDKSFRNLLIVSIAVLGFAQGLRNILGFVIA